MDLCFTKKQILSLLEQDATADPAAQAPTAGTSSKQAGGQGYPEVGKWESGIERGPANQVGVTKWADVVGSKLNRGKANQLKEQSSTWEKEKSKYVTDYERRELSKIDNQQKKIEDFNFEKFWDNSGPIILTIGSIAAATFIPGAQGLWVSIGLDLIAAADSYFRKNDGLGASLSVALAFVPFIGRSLPRFTNVSVETSKKLMSKFANSNSYQEIKLVMESLTKQERYLVQELVDLITQNPKRFQSIIKEVVIGQITSKKQAMLAAKKINDLIKLGSKRGGLDKVGAEKLIKNLNLRRFGLDFGVSGLITIGGWTYESWAQDLIKGTEISKDVLFYFQENAKLIKKINKNDFDSKVTPIMEKYQELAYTNDIKFLKLYNFVLRTYIQNPNSNFDELINKNYNKF
jgi:hypothetical protein